GRFEFACPDGDDSSLSLQAPDHLNATPNHRQLGPTSSACITEITWKVTVKRIGRLRGRVLDADTKKPLSELAVGVRAPDVGWGSEFRFDAVTDAQGQFTTPFTLKAGHVELLFADGADQEFVAGREEIE